MPRGVGRYDEARLQGRLWTPQHLPYRDEALWFDASRRDTISFSGTTVTAWASAYGNGRDSSSAVGSAVTLDMTGWNGRPAMVFNSGALDVPSGSRVNNGVTNGMTFLYVIKPTATGYWNVYDNASDGSHLSGPMLWYDNSGRWEPEVATQGSSNIGSGNGLQALLSWGYGGPMRACRTDARWVSGAYNAMSNGTVQHWNRGGSQVAQCVVAEWYMVGRRLSNADLERFRGYLAWKWWRHGEVLEAASAYRNTPPLLGT